MARTSGPFGPSGGALQRRPGQDPFGAPAAPAGQWPPHPQQGYGVPAPAPQSVQGYHFPPPEPEPAYGYNPQPLGGQPQWGQQPADPNGYELSYQAYNAADPPPFQNHQPQQGYPDQDADYGGEEYFEDEEPRRGRRWILIAAALIGAIGIGGALAYTYRSLVAPGPGRVPVAKVDSGAKAKPDFRGAAAERKEVPPSASEPSRDEPPADTASIGPRVVRPIPISPGGVAAAPEPPPEPTVPGITLYRPPQLPQPQAAPAVPPPTPPAQAMAAPQPPVRPVLPPQAAPQPPARVVLGTRPPAAETEDEPPAIARRPPVQTAALNPASPKAPPAKSASSGLGYVAVLSSKKSSMEALQVFADMQQQFPDVLGNKTPDVQEADLSSRGLGTMYRLVVGPPGSHNAARGVCAQLKTAGYEGCWVKEY